MEPCDRKSTTVRKIVAVLLVVTGLTTTWAWGQVAKLAEPAPTDPATEATAIYGAWQAEGEELPGLFRSTDEGATWTALDLPTGAGLLAWADDGSRRVVIAAADSTVYQSLDRGSTWTLLGRDLAVSSLLWDEDGGLYVGTEDQGILHLAPGGTLLEVSMAAEGLDSDRIVGLASAGGHVYAATPTTLFHSEAGADWTRTAPLPAQVTAIAATDAQTIYAGTTTSGVYRSTDAGLSWQPAWEGLGMAAGQMVEVTALRADPSEPGVLYAAVDHIVGSVHLHSSAAGVFVSLDGAASWQPLDGPAFPEAAHAQALVVVPGKPLYVQAVTASALQAYAPDVPGLLAWLESDEAGLRLSAARQLGLARPEGVWPGLLALLDDPDPAVALTASAALGRIDDPASVPGLLMAVENPSEEVRQGAARALGLMKAEPAVDALRPMLLLGEGLDVSAAGEALGRIGGPEATNVLLAALADPTPTARWHAAMAALEEMGSPAVEPLVELLAGQDAHLRRNAAQALGWVSSPAATEALVRTMRRDTDVTVRGQAAWALGEIGDPAARKALARAELRDPAPEVQAVAAWALSQVPASGEPTSRWTERWASVLGQLQPLRWLVLAMALAGAGWLVTKDRLRAAKPQPHELGC